MIEQLKHIRADRPWTAGKHPPRRGAVAGLIWLAGAAILLGSACAAQASDTKLFKFDSLNNDLDVHLTFDSQGLSRTAGTGVSQDWVYAGRYNAKFDNSTAFQIFCTSYTHEIHVGETYNTLKNLGHVTDPAQSLLPTGGSYYYGTSGNAGGIKSAFPPPDLPADNYSPYINPGLMSKDARAGRVAYIVDNYLNVASLSSPSLGWGGTDTQVNRAAAQLAIWDIIQDGGDGFSAGDLRNDSAKNNATQNLAIAYANGLETYLNTVFGNNTYFSNAAFWIQAPRTDANGGLPVTAQDFAYHDDTFHTTGFGPEPAFYQMSALLGLGGFGLLRRRKTARTSDAA